MSSTTVPYVALDRQHAPLKAGLLAAVERVLEHGGFILGAEVEAFEEAFASLCGTRHSVGVDNGTSALLLALRCLGIGPGDEVITAPNSFLASASAIALTGARPVFADVGEDYNLDPERVEAAVSRRTRAILPVHLTGRPAAMDAIEEIARRHDLLVIEDAAQAVGARYRSRPVGGIGRAGCFSLHPLKNLSALGDGGVITTDDDDLATMLRQARNHGLRDREVCGFWSPNCRLDALQAALLRVKLDHLDAWTEARRRNAAVYRAALRDVVEVPEELPHEYAVYHTFVVQAARRDELQRFLEKRGIGSRVHYPIPIHQQPAAAELGYAPGSFPRAEQQAERILSLPIYPELTAMQIETVIDGVRAFYGRGPADGAS